METVLASSLSASVAPQALASRQAQLSGSSFACSSQQSTASAAGPMLVQIRASKFVHHGPIFFAPLSFVFGFIFTIIFTYVLAFKP